MKILVTAFDPFGGEKVNPALEAVKLLPDSIGGAEVCKLMVPTVFRKSIEVVKAEMEKIRPDAVMCVGQAGGRFGITPERIAINLDDARIKDNEGNQPADAAIYEDGEVAYFSTLPVKKMVSAMQEAGVPASLSYSAGTFVCNHLMYGVLYQIEKSYPGMKGGFVHVPFILDQVISRPNTPALSTETIVKGLTLCVKTIAESL